MPIYRVPYKLTSRGASTKARLVYTDEPGTLWLEFTARNHREAREALQELIANGDGRPVYGRSNVAAFAVKESDPDRESLVARGERAFAEGGQAWADWNVEALDLGD